MKFYIFCRKTFFVICNFIFDRLALTQSLVSINLNFREVDENLTVLVTLNKPIAFIITKPLNRPLVYLCDFYHRSKNCFLRLILHFLG